MAWGSHEESTALTLTSSWQDVQRSAADWEVTLNPGETAHIQFEFAFEATQTDDGMWEVLTSTDGGTTYDTVAFDGGLVAGANGATYIQGTILRGPHTFKFVGKQTGSTDTTNTLTVHVRKDGVSL